MEVEAGGGLRQREDGRPGEGLPVGWVKTGGERRDGGDRTTAEGRMPGGGRTGAW